MLPEFECLAKTNPHEICFTFVEKDGFRSTVSYEKLRRQAAALAIILQRRGVGRKSLVILDMENCPAFVVSIFAAAYGGFALIALNHRLTEDEKASRLADLKLLQNLNIALRLDEGKVEALLDEVDLLGREEVTGSGLFWEKKKRTSVHGGQANALSARELVHFAERSTALFDLSARALVLFTSGTSGRPKAVSLSWNNLCSAAEASNTSLSVAGCGLWQAALPLFHIGGFEIVVRSVLNTRPFLLYRRFDAKQVLQDATEYGVSHLSVVDKMLQDLIAANYDDLLSCYSSILLGGAAANPLTLAKAVAQRARVYVSYGMTETSSFLASSLATQEYDGSLALLSGYEAEIINPDERGFGQLAVKGPGVFSGYLNAQAAFTADGFFLTGDTASLKKGRLKVQERLSDMFVSGGENIYPAEIQDKLLRVPGVRDAYVFGVADAKWGRRPVAFVEREVCLGDDASQEQCFFGTSLGKAEKILSSDQPFRSIAASAELATFKDVEACAKIISSPQAFAVDVEKSLEQRLSKLYRPKHLCVLHEFPRIGIGKIDREDLLKRYKERIEIHEVKLYHIKQKFLKPVVTAKTTLRSRESIIVEVVDSCGRTGLGECVSFPTNWYLSETLVDDFRVLENHLIPLVLQQIYLHPREASTCFDECAEATGYSLAKAALEPALWDLYGKIVGKPLWRLLQEEIEYCDQHQKGLKLDSLCFDTMVTGQNRESYKVSRLSAISNGVQELSSEYTAVPAGVVLGILSERKTLDAVRRAVDMGYTRVKLKVKTGDDFSRIRAVRQAFPDLMIMIDANQAYTERDQEKLKALDDLNIRCIEEPLDPVRVPRVGPDQLFDRLARLQKAIKTPLCLDESIVTPRDLEEALKSFDLRCFAFKIAKWGGVEPALQFYRYARDKGIDLWMGGMYETGISKSLHAAFGTLPGITIPGDLASSSQYFSTDICEPAFETVDGSIILNQPGYETGLGCILNRKALSQVLVFDKTYKREIV